jgi:hypothetical protein
MKAVPPKRKRSGSRRTRRARQSIRRCHGDLSRNGRSGANSKATLTGWSRPSSEVRERRLIERATGSNGSTASIRKGPGQLHSSAHVHPDERPPQYEDGAHQFVLRPRSNGTINTTPAELRPSQDWLKLTRPINRTNAALTVAPTVLRNPTAPPMNRVLQPARRASRLPRRAH